MKTIKNIIEENDLDKGPPHWITKKAAIKAAEEYAMQQVLRERNRIKRKLMKWADTEKNHDNLLYPWKQM